MANSSFKKRDLNRFRKVYPYNRRREKLSVIPEDGAFTVEVGIATFTGQNSVTVNLTAGFTATPIVTATSIDSASNNQANVNISISAVSTSSVTFLASAAFTGTVHFHAIQVTG